MPNHNVLIRQLSDEDNEALSYLRNATGHASNSKALMAAAHQFKILCDEIAQLRDENDILRARLSHINGQLRKLHDFMEFLGEFGDDNSR